MLVRTASWFSPRAFPYARRVAGVGLVEPVVGSQLRYQSRSLSGAARSDGFGEPSPWPAALPMTGSQAVLLWTRRQPARHVPHCCLCLDAIASSPDRELARGDFVPMHRMPRLRRGGTPACRPSQERTERVSSCPLSQGSTTPGRRCSAPPLGVTRCAVRARRLLRLLEEQHGQAGRRAERPRDRRLARAPQAHVTPLRGGRPRR